MATERPQIIDRIVSDLLQRRAMRSTADLAREYLGLGVLDEQIAERLLGDLLARDTRLSRSAHGWTAHPDASLEVGLPLAATCLAIAAPRTVAAVDHLLIPRTDDQERLQAAYTVSIHGRSERELAALRLATLRPPPRDVALLDVARRWCGYRGAPQLERIAAHSGLRHLLPEDGQGTARCIAELWQAWRESLHWEDVTTLEGLDRLLEARLERASFEGKLFGPEQLWALPPTPGVYAFADAAGRWLYVGQSRALGTRVRSYFVGPPRDAKDRTLRGAAHRLETRSLATGLDALLLEQRWILRRRPLLNRQRERAEKPVEDGLLAVAATDPVRAPYVLYVVRHGRLAKRVAVRPGPSAAQAALRRIAAACFDPGSSVPDDPATAAIFAHWRRTHPLDPFIGADELDDTAGLRTVLNGRLGVSVF